MIQAADKRSVVGRKALVVCPADVRIHVRAGEQRPVVQGDGFTPHPDRSDAFQPREVAGTPALNDAMASASNLVIGLADVWKVRDAARVDARVLRGRSTGRDRKGGPKDDAVIMLCSLS